jgi:CheY-like chemotaxis protein
MPADERELLVLGLNRRKERGDLLCSYLKDAGYSCRMAEIEDLSVSKPVGILLDLSPYAEDPWGILTKIKADRSLRDIPVMPLFLSEEGAIGAVFPVTGFFTLPIDEEHLIKRLAVFGLTDEVEDWDLQALLVSRSGEEKVGKALESVGFEVVKSYTGKEAIAVSTTGKQYLAFCSVMLPDMSAFDLLDRMRLYPQTHNIPYFILLRETMKEGEKNAMSKEIAHLVSKKKLSKEEFLSYLRRKG